MAYSEYASGQEQCVHIWDVQAARERSVLRVADGLMPFHVAANLGFSPDGRTLAVGQFGPTDRNAALAEEIQLWDIDAARLIRKLPGPVAEGCQRLHFSAGGAFLATTFLDQTKYPPMREVMCWEVSTGAETFRFAGEIIHAGADRLWLAESYNSTSYEVRTFEGIADRVPVADGPAPEPYHQPLAPNGKTMLISSVLTDPIADWVEARGLTWPFERLVVRQGRFVDVMTGKVIGYLPRDPVGPKDVGPVFSRWFSPDGDLFAVVDDRSITIWDVPPRKPLTWFLGGVILGALPILWFTRRRIRGIEARKVTVC